MKKVQTFNCSYWKWKRTIRKLYKKDGCINRLRIQRRRKIFRCNLNDYVVITGTVKPAGKIAGITVIGSGDGSKKSGITIMYGFILLISSLFPKYTTFDLQYILRQLRLIGNERIQSDSRIFVDGVTYRLIRNEAGTWLSCTPDENTRDKESPYRTGIRGFDSKVFAKLTKKA